MLQGHDIESFAKKGRNLMKVNALTEKYEHVELFGKPVLFTNNRPDRTTVPNGLYCYNLRGGDNDSGIPVTLGENVGMNHIGIHIQHKSSIHIED